MSVRLARGTTMRELVLFLRTADAGGTSRRDVLTVLTERFALPFDDARLAMDRVQGGVVRASSGLPENEPDRDKDPLAWTSYQLELGLPVDDEPVGPSAEERAAAVALLERAARGEAPHPPEDVAVAVEATRLALASPEPGSLVAAATAISVTAEARIAGLGHLPCAPEGTPEWTDGVVLVAAARQIAAAFGALPDPGNEERAFGLAGRIATGLLGQSYVFVGRAMVESARAIQRGGYPDRAADRAEAMLADFALLLDQFEDDEPYDEQVVALEYLLEAVELVRGVRGSSPELDELAHRTSQVLAR
ncbi:hypothetical protein L3i22_086840 [Actinoplanes sp. L3-i22]|nr:hypothetical protein L3i22_086840 [Actinoplanes sp. L3-i22]